MSKIIVTGPKTYMDKVIRKLHALKVLHIVDHHKTDDIDIGSPLDNASEISDIIVRIRSLQSYLDVKAKDLDGYHLKNDIKEIDQLSKELAEKVNEKLNEIKEIEDQTKDLSEKKLVLEKLQGIGISLDAFQDYNSICYMIGQGKGLDGLKKELEGKNIESEVYLNKDNSAFVLFTQVENKDKALELLQKKFGYVEIPCVVKGMKGSVESNLSDVSGEIEKRARRLEFQKEALAKLKAKWANFLLLSEKKLDNELDKLRAPLRFATTANAFVIKGWLPSKKYANVEKELKDVTKNKIHIQMEEIKKGEKVPVELKNSKVSKPFEIFMHLYTLPSYKELDPTTLMSFFFPAFFGFMLGDMGYGLLTVLAAVMLRKKMPQFRDFFTTFFYFGLSTMFFGALFGEVLGAEVIFGIELPHILSRAHEFMTLLYAAIIIGVVHLNLGLILGFYNEIRSHGFKVAFLEKISWMILQVGMFPLLLSQLLFGYIVLSTVQIWVFLGIFLVALFLLYKGEGVGGIVEFPGILSNVLSYARLMAIALASVQLAMVVNTQSGSLFASGSVGGFIGGTLIFLVGHAINLALGWIGCFLHSLRLHYVEFFSKFLKGGAKQFQPFGLKNE